MKKSARFAQARCRPNQVEAAQVMAGQFQPWTTDNPTALFAAPFCRCVNRAKGLLGRP
ncbi:hypothetical protein [Ruegeria sp. THAF33]|uniref:hypothetical protein n=1 Tax=Ruegeria sp. THAF33 TaxID=2587853 RepID=UPI0015621231|nr:hypothetical protein [Ruegeria sp. THAF33]